MDETAMRRVLEAGNSAPSGENSQPWMFKVSNDMVQVLIDPEKDRSLYNWSNRASYLAAGACIENMRIAATAEGYDCEIKKPPSTSDEHVVASIRFHQGATLDPLAGFIMDRATNRKTYFDLPLYEEDKTVLQQCSKGSSATLRFVQDRDEMSALGAAAATNEMVMLTNRRVHEFFYSHVSWTKSEDDVNRVGFYLKTLELPAPAVAIFKLLRSWPRARLLTALGLHRLVAAANAQTNATGSAIVALTTTGIEKDAFIDVGQLLERLWLSATSRGLYLQPLAGMLFLALQVGYGDAAAFSTDHVRLIKTAYATTQRILGTDDHVVFMFRIGKADPPSARASRFPIENTYV